MVATPARLGVTATEGRTLTVFDDDGDIDHNGIPDSIQRDPVVERDPVTFGQPADEGPPGITSPIDATAEPMPQPPVAPAPPPDGADEATMARYQADMAKYQQMMELLSNITANAHEMKKSIIDNIRS